MAKIMENRYEINKNIGNDILRSFFENEYYNCVDADEEKVYYNNLFIDDSIVLLKEIAKQFNEAVNNHINELNNL